MGANGGTAWVRLRKGSSSSELGNLLLYPLLCTSRHGVKWDLVPNDCIAAEYGTHLPFCLLDLSEIVGSIENLSEDQQQMTWEEYAVDVYTDPMFNDDYYRRDGTTLQSLVSYLFLGSAWSFDKPTHEPSFKYYEEDVWPKMKLIDWCTSVKALCYPESSGHQETWT